MDRTFIAIDVETTGLEAGTDERRLQATQVPLIRRQGHDAEVRLVTEHRDDDHLVAPSLCLLHGPEDLRAVRRRPDVEEEVSDGEADGRGGRLGHGRSLRLDVRPLLPEHRGRFRHVLSISAPRTVG